MKERRKADPRDVLNLAGSFIALILVSLLGFSLWALFYFDSRPTNHDILLMVITFLTAKIGTIVDFFYSSSAGSRNAQDTITTLANTASAAQAALPSVPGAPGDGSTINLAPGESAKATATESGTEIKPDK